MAMDCRRVPGERRDSVGPRIRMDTEAVRHMERVSRFPVRHDLDRVKSILHRASSPFDPLQPANACRFACLVRAAAFVRSCTGTCFAAQLLAEVRLDSGDPPRSRHVCRFIALLSALTRAESQWFFAMGQLLGCRLTV